jgi:hypothetical protein
MSVAVPHIRSELPVVGTVDARLGTWHDARVDARRIYGCLVVSVALTAVLASCGSDESPIVSCQLQVDGQTSTVTFPGAVGSSSSGQVGDFKLTFSVLSQRRLHTEVTKLSTGEFVMTTEAGGLAGGGSSGSLSYSCGV